MNKQIDILLVNLGSPNALSGIAIKAFLKRFLLDKRVVNLPFIPWWLLLNGVILPKRSKKLQALYETIWLKQYNKSPLIYYTERQAMLLNLRLQTLFSKQQQEKSNAIASQSDDEEIDDTTNNNNDCVIHVHHAFCYSAPFIYDVLAKIKLSSSIASKLIVIPLFPQFSSATTLAVFDQVCHFYKSSYHMPELSLITSFATHKMYIQCLASKIKHCVKSASQYVPHTSDASDTSGAPERIILSYHGLPNKLITQGDTYYQECLATSTLIAKELNRQLGVDCLMSFQSKFGYAKWLSPDTSTTIINLAKQGVKKIVVICPGFVSDCLETLEEIAIQNKQLFLANGGIHYDYISAFNDDMLFIDVLQSLVEGKLADSR